MDISKFYEYCNELSDDSFPLAVRMKYKYSNEIEYTESDEVLDIGYGSGIGRDYIWFNDWYEGQQDVKIIAWLSITDALDEFTTDSYSDS